MSGDLPDFTITLGFASGDVEVSGSFRDGFAMNRGSTQPSMVGLVADPGQMTFMVENFDRAFDPSVDVVPGVPITVVATWDSVDYPLFAGRVTAWPQVFGTAGLDQIVEITAQDAVSALARARVKIDLPRQTTGERMDSVLTAIGWPGPTDLDVGTRRLPRLASSGGAYAWQIMGDGCATERGYLWIEGDGTTRFLDRNGIFDLSSTPLAVFGDRPDLGELPYDDLTLPYDDSRTVNDADNGWNASGDVAHAEDLVSQGEPWGFLTWSQNIPMETASQAISYVKHVVREFATPTQRVSAIRLTPQDQPADMWPVVLGMEPGQKFTVKKTPQGGGARIEQDVYLRGFEPSLTGSTYSQVCAFDDANLNSVTFRLGDGVLADGSQLLGS